jgi:microcystin-dependent protein
MATSNFKAKYGVQVADASNASAPAGAKSGYDLLPVGSIMYWAGDPANPPTGWLLCDGSTQSRSAYPNLNALFNADSYPYGSGDGSTTFHLPDARGRALQYSSSPTKLSGQESRTLSDTEIKGHAHPLGGHSHPTSSHTHAGVPHTHTFTPSSHSHDLQTGHAHTGAADITHSHNWSTSGNGGPGTARPRIPGAAAPPSAPAPTVATFSGGVPHVHPPAVHTVTSLEESTGALTDPPSSSSDTSTSNTGDSSVASTGYSGATTRTAIPIMQPFTVICVLIKAL